MSTTVAGWIAIGAAAVAVVALVLVVALLRDLRRLRSAQQVLLGGANRDLADFAVSLQARVDDLHRAVDEVAAAIARVDRRADTTLSAICGRALRRVRGRRRSAVGLGGSARLEPLGRRR